MPAGNPVVAAANRLIRLVDSATTNAPTVLMLDDFQCADEASIELSRRLFDATAQQRTLFIVAADPGHSDGRMAGLRQSAADRGGAVLTLGPMSEDEVTLLAALVTGAPPGPRLTAWIRCAGGNPMCITEVLADLIRHGDVAITDGYAEFRPDMVSPAQTSQLARRIRGRLDLVDSDVLGFLQVAVLLGVDVSIAELACVSGRSPAQVAQFVSAAHLAGLLNVDGDRVSLGHRLARQLLRDSVPVTVRVAVHGEMARSFAEAGAGVERVAVHLLAAGNVDQWTRDWLASSAGELSARAPTLAGTLLTRALAETDPDHPAYHELESAAMNVTLFLAQPADTERYARAVLARAPDPEQFGVASWMLSYAQSFQERHEDAMAGAALAAEHEGLPAHWVARLRARQAAAAVVTGHFDMAQTAADAAMVEAQACTDRAGIGYALNVLALLASRRGDQVEAGRLIDSALSTVGVDPQTTDLRLLLSSNLISNMSITDRLADALTVARVAVLSGEEAGSPRQAMLRLHCAQILHCLGQWDDALAELAVLADLQIASWALRARAIAASIAAHRDERIVFAGHLQAIDALGIDDPFEVRDVMWSVRAVVAERDRGPGAVASELASVLFDPRQTNNMDLHFHLPVLARCALEDNDMALARAAADASVEYAVARTWPSVRSGSLHCRGLVAGDPVLVRDAADLMAQAARPYDRAVALEDAAVLFAQSGEVTSAQEAFNRATALYHELGAVWDIRRADSRLRRLGIRRGQRGSRRRPGHGWAALTPTERHIAGLVAEGYSNVQIAGQLFLSYRTVQVHVSNILSKLPARSRVQLATETLRHRA
jgi:DNA-binding CsgD family transcriptional regulator